MLRVTAVTPLDPYRLRVEFNDGVARDVDCAFLLHGTLGEPLRDPDYFRQVRVDQESRTIVWPNGLDPAPELLHGDYESASTSVGDSQQAAVWSRSPPSPACGHRVGCRHAEVGFLLQAGLCGRWGRCLRPNKSRPALCCRIQLRAAVWMS